jgi:hypothetical protein
LKIAGILIFQGHLKPIEVIAGVVIKAFLSAFNVYYSNLHITGNRASFVGYDIFVGIDEYNLNYIHWYHKPTNIVYIRQFTHNTDEYMGCPV